MSIREKYEQHGADEYYRKFGDAYRNPHEPEIQDVISVALKVWPLDLSNVLDLAAGSGEVTLALAEHHGGNITGIDPFTAAAYAQRTGKGAEQFDFAQIAAGALEGRRYSLIVCSFALHLCEPSRLPALAYRLAQISHALLILTPHKRPQIDREWGWELVGEFVRHRVRARFYRAMTPDAQGEPSLSRRS